MSANSFGKLFCLTSFGESHGAYIGGVIDGCPPNIDLDFTKIQYELQRRRPGQSSITTQRKEADEVEFISGIFEGKTSGMPIAFLIKNKDQKSADYTHIKDQFRPSHADYTWQKKYGIRDYKGGGRSSARETAVRVVAGAIAKQVLEKKGVLIQAFTYSIGDLSLTAFPSYIDASLIEKNLVRCPDEVIASEMIASIEAIKKAGDSLGGVVACRVLNTPVGLGDPVYERLEANLAKAMLSINATKGFEIGSGFEGTRMLGSEHNDQLIKEGKELRTKTNHSGGVQGGVSNGMPIEFKVAFKPVATLMKEQASIDKEGNEIIVKGKGRHDPCVVPRAVPIVEAMTALVLLDHLMINNSLHLNS
jgi:chorismate synthase